MQPVAVQIVKSANQKGHTGHHRISKRSPEGNHQKVDSDSGDKSKTSLMLFGEEEVKQTGNQTKG